MSCRRLLIWLLAVSLYAISGAAAGCLLDRLFWHISYDYIYRPRQFLEGATKVGVLLGALSAAFATVGSPAPAQPRALITSWLSTLIGAAFFGLLIGFLGAGLSKWFVAGVGEGSLAPRARLWFCEGLRMGVLVATVVATCVWNFVIFRRRYRGSRN